MASSTRRITAPMIPKICSMLSRYPIAAMRAEAAAGGWAHLALIIMMPVRPMESAIVITRYQFITDGLERLASGHSHPTNRSDRSPAATAKVCERITFLGLAVTDMGV